MASNTTSIVTTPSPKQPEKHQPWRSIWPAPRESQPQAQIFGFKKGEVMVFDGNAGNFFVRNGWKVEQESDKDPLYDTEKPYSLRFTPPDGFPRANIKLEKHNITVYDARNSRRAVTFDRDGAELIELHSKMGRDDFDDEDKIKAVYLREVANVLKHFFKAQHVQIFEHTVRKRHEIFPISTGEPYRYNQPTSIAHVDTTVPWALAMARQLNPDRIDQIRQHRVQCVNFWKPLRGPVKDWPLALCSAQSMNLEELQPCDLVYPDYVVENQQVYYSPRWDWFYVSDQLPHEAWVFMQADTNPEVKPVAHTAFPIGAEDGDPTALPQRESIEVRALVYYGGFEDT